MIDMDDYLPCPGRAGVRLHPETLEPHFSSAWLGDFAEGETPLTEALAIAAGLASHPRVEQLRAEEHPVDPEGARILAFQARTRPADGDIGPGGARTRSKPCDPAGRPVVAPEALGGDARQMTRRFISQSMAATVRHLERLLALETDPMGQQVVAARLRQQEILRAMFEDDATRG